MLDCALSGGKSISIADNSSDAQKIGCKLKGLIAGARRIGKDGRAIRHQYALFWIFTTVTSRQDANLLSGTCEYASYPFYERCLSCSAGCDVADTYYRSFQFESAKCASCV